MDETGTFIYFHNRNVKPTSVHRAELSYKVLMAELPMHIDPRILDSLPWRKVNDFLAAVGKERSLEGLAHRVLQEIGALLPFDYGFFTVVDPRIINQPRIFDFRTPPGAMKEYFAYYITVDPAISFVPSTLRGVAKWTRLDCEFTHDYLRRYGTRHSLVVGNLQDTDEVGFNMALHRITRSAFNEREVAVYFILRPHLHNLFSLVHAPQEARRNRLAAALSACGLTSREEEIVLLLCERLSALEIGERLKISRRTVEKHIEHVYLKLSVHNRRGLREERILANALGNVLENRRA